MTSNPRTVEPGASAQEVARLMKSEDVGSIPIVEGDRLTAIVTDRDIALNVVAGGKSVGDDRRRVRRRASSSRSIPRRAWRRRPV